jgi:hypothetical protein
MESAELLRPSPYRTLSDFRQGAHSILRGGAGDEVFPQVSDGDVTPSRERITTVSVDDRAAQSCYREWLSRLMVRAKRDALPSENAPRYELRRMAKVFEHNLFV